MNKAMFAGLSGTIAQQTKLDVIGNNIANSETTGFKQSRVTFADAYYQTMRGGSSGAAASTGGGAAGLGGINPQQVGSGVRVATVQNLFDQGPVSNTGRALDAALEGPGMFVLSDGNQVSYTRDGSFGLDDTGTLVSTGTGMKALGWMASGGVVNTAATPSAMSFHLGEMRPGTTTHQVNMGGNIAPTTATGGQVGTSIEVYDSLGSAHTVNITLTKTAIANQWTCTATSGSDTASGTVTFDSSGAVASGGTVALNLMPGGGAAGSQAINVQLGGVTQLSGDSDLLARSQDGSQAAALLEVGFGEDGAIEGKYSDGRSETLGRIAVAGFANQEGLERTGNNLYQASAASGETQIGPANSSGRGRVVSRSLEQSNVDLTRSFVDMITTQRGFQASTRAISTADKLMEDVMQIVR